jgi:drug/metabolite transporter (DMT)-like permease
LAQDWRQIRGSFAIMVLLSLTGISAFNTMQYWSLEHTQAINTLLLQPTAPLFVAMWSLALFGTRLTAAQAIGILLSLVGVLVIMLRGDLTSLKDIDFNRGDLIFVLALLIFGLYSVMTAKRPAIHPLSFVAFTFGCGAACLIPFFIWELHARPAMELNGASLLTLFYVAVFPSTLAYLCFNRGVALIGANRAAPFFHLVPVFGTVMSILFLAEHPQLFHFVGFALVLTGVFVASRKPETAPKTQ